MSEVRRCEWCSARLGARDRVCFSCHRPVTAAASAGPVAEPDATLAPAAPPDARALTAEMVVLAGDGLLREAFRRELNGDAALLAESSVVLSSYLAHRLGSLQPGVPGQSIGGPGDVR